ncbi:non-ribosomal peptide synthetase [Anaerosporobacter sp.]
METYLVKESVMDKWNETTLIYDEERTIHSLFEEVVEKYQDKIALRCMEEYITYNELNEKSNQIARKLREFGVKPDSIVGLMCTRSVYMFIGMLGILKAGGCYLPLDPKFPKERIRYMLDDSETEILVTQKELSTLLEFDGNCVIMEQDVQEYDKSNLTDLNKSKDLAYVIYTSGSTGKPKGVMLEHKSVHNFILGMKKLISFIPEKKIVSLTTISFDIFVLESLLPLTVGMEVVIAEPMDFQKYMKEKHMDMLQTTPSTMKLLLKDKDNIPYIRNLSDIMLGGETFPEPLLEDLKHITKARIYNMYGPTETTVWSTVKDLTDTDHITIGYPISNTRIYILDDENKIVGPGQPGELCIGGDGVARGYLYRDDLTNQRFIRHPLIEGDRLYRTGDVAQWLNNGELKLLGRIDSQVKVRGFRIELGEIENLFIKFNKVKNCAVAVKEVENGDKVLVAYYTSNETLLVSEINQYLKENLPEYMIPGIYIQVDEIPLTPNGKIDRNALPLPDTRRPLMDVQYVEPSSNIEKIISDVCRKVLNKDKIGICDNFFELGGNSILICQLNAELKNLFPNLITITDIFSYPCIKELAEFIEKSTKKKKYIFSNFPKDYYSVMQERGKKSCSVILPNEKKQIMQNIEKYYNVALNDIMTILYMYVIEQICETNISYSLLYHTDLEIYEYMKCNFSDNDNLIGLCKDRINRDIQYDVLLRRNDFEEIMNKSSMIIPTLFFQEMIREPEIMEFACSIFDVDEGMKIEAIYDRGTIEEEHVKEFMSLYVDLIYMLITQHEN